jgi:hypothetical protein
MGAQILPSALALPSNRGSNCKGTHNTAKAIIRLSQTELDEIISNEWNFTYSKILDNFSNGSAFHYDRSFCLQTQWCYHQFEMLLFEMADSLRDLLEVEKGINMLGNVIDEDECKGAKCKWAYIVLHMVFSTL